MILTTPINKKLTRYKIYEKRNGKPGDTVLEGLKVSGKHSDEELITLNNFRHDNREEIHNIR